MSNIITHDCHSQQENLLFYRTLLERPSMQHFYAKSMNTTTKPVKNTVEKYAYPKQKYSFTLSF
jgi:hypothetical protein